MLFRSIDFHALGQKEKRGNGSFWPNRDHTLGPVYTLVAPLSIVTPLALSPNRKEGKCSRFDLVKAFESRTVVSF